MASSNNNNNSMAGIRITLLLLFLFFLWGVAEGATVKVTNNCPYTIWPATVNPKASVELPHGQIWSYNVTPGNQAGRLWARTNCTGGPHVCGGGGGRGGGEIPATLVEYTLNGAGNKDLYDISLVNGFNVPVSIAPNTKKSSNRAAAGPSCATVSCAKNLNVACPAELRLSGASFGCRSACAAFPDNDEYCCRGAYGGGPLQCPPSKYAIYFKTGCPGAYSYAYDRINSTFSCPGGSTDYDVVFCP